MLSEREGEGYRIPRIIYADAYFSEMVAYADLILPDTTYLERYDCISLLDRPISHADSAGDAIRQPVVAPDRDVRPFQDVLIELGARLKLPGLVELDGRPKYPGLYADYIVNHQRKPGIGMLAGWRGDGSKQGSGEPNPNQLERYIAHGCFWHYEIPEDQRFFRHANKGYLDWAASMGFVDHAEPVVLQLYSEVLQKFRLAAQGHGAVQPPERDRPRIAAYFDPLPIWYRPLEEGAAAPEDEFPLHAVTQRPMAMYHAWGSQNAWLRQIHGANRLFVNRRTGERLGLADDDWVWIESPHGQVKAQIRLMEGVNEQTVWSWNAIGKRAGAWNLSAAAPESRRGFLLNHAISELLPAQPGGYRYSNSDPVTGQAAWYDLKVRIVKASADEAAETSPQFHPLPRPPGMAPAPEVLRYGARFRGRREKAR